MDLAANGAAGGGDGRPLDEGLVVFTAPAPRLPIARVFALADGPIAAWSSPEPEADGRAWSIVGWGEAARIEARGASRIASIRSQGARVFDALRGRICARRGGRLEASIDRGGAQGEGLLSIRLFGGIAFDPRSDRAGARPEAAIEAPPWRAFTDASFTMPRWLYGISGDEACVRLAVPRSEEPGALDRIERVLGRLEAIAATTPAASIEALSSSGAAIISDGEAPSTTRQAWRSMVIDALDRIRDRELDKVVAAALRRLVLAEPVAIGPMIQRMEAAYPECARFALQRGAATFAGASPERLVAVRGLCVEADALAGSARRSANDDAGAARALVESDKDRREHALVVAAIDGALRSLCRTLHVPDAPVVRTLRNVHHLWTPIAGDLARPTHVLDLVELLHPTPAVCGWPRDAALAWISSRERAPRGWYAGAVGWFDDDGDGSFAVAIRSGLFEGKDAWLYAGAGLVEGSEPDAELAETRAKQAPILAALGLSP